MCADKTEEKIEHRLSQELLIVAYALSKMAIFVRANETVVKIDNRLPQGL